MHALFAPRRLAASLASLWLLSLSACWSTANVPVRATQATDARSDDPWIDGDRCTDEMLHEPDLRMEDVVVGTGRAFSAGDTVRAHYVASLTGGQKLHDSRSNGPPVEIILGSSRAICGFERALVGMHPGGQRRVQIPWRLAFGEAGRAPDIAPRTDLVVVIDAYAPSVLPSNQGGPPVNPGRGGGGRVR